MFKTVFKTVFLHPKSALSRLKHTTHYTSEYTDTLKRESCENLKIKKC